jgi:hypothetical protein
MGNNRNRGHHTVSKFYLANFAQKGKKTDKIWVANLATRTSFGTSTEKASIENDFYSIDPLTQEATGLSESFFEEALSKIEGAAGNVFHKILVEKVWPLGEEDRVVLAYYITIQFLRGRNQRHNADKIASTMLAISIAANGKDKVPEELWEKAKKGDLAINYTPTYHTAQIFDFLESIVPFIYSRVWSLVHFQKENLITCDTPVVLVPPLDASTNREGVGVGNASALYLPLSRKVGLVMIDRRAFDSIPDDLIHDIQKLTIMTLMLSHLIKKSSKLQPEKFTVIRMTKRFYPIHCLNPKRIR